MGYGIGIVDNVKIDEINIKQASRLAMKIAISNIKDLDGNKVSGDFLITFQCNYTTKLFRIQLSITIVITQKFTSQHF